MFAAYDALPDEMRARIEGLRVIISRVRSEAVQLSAATAGHRGTTSGMAGHAAALGADAPPQRAQGALRRRQCALVIEGMDEAESTPLITALQAHGFQPAFTYAHAWRPGDLLMWDNRSSLHTGDRLRCSRASPPYAPHGSCRDETHLTQPADAIGALGERRRKSGRAGAINRARVLLLQPGDGRNQGKSASRWAIWRVLLKITVATLGRRASEASMFDSAEDSGGPWNGL